MDDDVDGLYGGPRSKPIPLTELERLFEAYQEDTARSMVARNNYEATIKNCEDTSNKRITTRSDLDKHARLISKDRSNYRDTLRRALSKAQSLQDRAFADNDDIYHRLTVKNMKKDYNKLYKLDVAGLRRKRNKSRKKMYSARKKSKRRRVKSTRRRHKKSTRHHHSKY